MFIDVTHSQSNMGGTHKVFFANAKEWRTSKRVTARLTCCTSLTQRANFRDILLFCYITMPFLLLLTFSKQKLLYNCDHSFYEYMQMSLKAHCLDTFPYYVLLSGVSCWYTATGWGEGEEKSWGLWISNFMPTIFHVYIFLYGTVCGV